MFYDKKFKFWPMLSVNFIYNIFEKTIVSMSVSFSYIYRSGFFIESLCTRVPVSYIKLNAAACIFLCMLQQLLKNRLPNALRSIWILNKQISQENHSAVQRIRIVRERESNRCRQSERSFTVWKIIYSILTLVKMSGWSDWLKDTKH